MASQLMLWLEVRLCGKADAAGKDITILQKERKGNCMLKKIILLIGMLVMLPARSGAGSEYVADGVGATEKAALQGCFRTAMEHVIRHEIDSRTYARNHQIIRDQILAHTEDMCEVMEFFASSWRVRLPFAAGWSSIQDLMRN